MHWKRPCVNWKVAAPQNDPLLGEGCPKASLSGNSGTTITHTRCGSGCARQVFAMRAFAKPCKCIHQGDDVLLTTRSRAKWSNSCVSLVKFTPSCVMMLLRRGRYTSRLLPPQR